MAKKEKKYEPLAQATPLMDWAYQPARKIDFSNADTIRKFERWRKDWGNTINEAAKFYNVPPAKIYAMIEQESGGNPNAISEAGPYYGLLQVEKGSFDPHKNIWQGMNVLRAKEDGIKWVMGGDYRPSDWEVLGAYNWGQGNWGKYLKNKKQIPQETRQYIADINYNTPMFEQWLAGKPITAPPTGTAPQNRPLVPIVLEAPPMNMPIMTPDKTRTIMRPLPMPREVFEDYQPSSPQPVPRDNGGWLPRNIPNPREPIIGIGG